MIPFIANGLLWWLSGKDSVCKCRRCGFNLWVGKIPWRKKCQPTSVFLSGKSHGQRSLAGYSPWGHKKSQIGLSKLLLLFIGNIYAILKKKKKTELLGRKSSQWLIGTESEEFGWLQRKHVGIFREMELFYTVTLW